DARVYRHGRILRWARGRPGVPEPGGAGRGGAESGRAADSGRLEPPGRAGPGRVAWRAPGRGPGSGMVGLQYRQVGCPGAWASQLLTGRAGPASRPAAAAAGAAPGRGRSGPPPWARAVVTSASVGPPSLAARTRTGAAL